MNFKYYSGVIAYGTGEDKKAYVLKVYPDTPNEKFNSVFVILEANETATNTIFNEDDEMGEGIVFSEYDEAIEGFEEFLAGFCLIYRDCEI